MAELTQRFSGRSLEEAIGNATDALGSGAEVIEAKRVRRGGILGVMKHETYEVSARARPAASRPVPSRSASPRAASAYEEQSTPARGRRGTDTPRTSPSFENELRSMIDEVDLREERQILGQAPSRSGRPRVSNRFTDDDLAPLPAEPARAAAAPRANAGSRAAAAPRATTAPRQAAPARAAAGAGATASRRESATEKQLSRALATSPMSAAPGEPLPPPPGQDGRRASTIDLREERGNGPEWSTERLRELGVAESVLELMPTASLDSDVAWTVALEAAIRARLPLTPTVPLAVHGYGDNAAVKMLESTLNGYAMGDLHLIDRVVPATSFELALAIRACLSR